MKFYWMVVGFVLVALMASCGMNQPAVWSPTATNTAPLPTATLILTATAIPTNTPIPSTATATVTLLTTATNIPSATATATLPPTATPTLPPFLVTKDTPPLPAGKGGLIIYNHFGEVLSYDIGGKVYQVPAYSRMIIFLSPGHYTFSASAASFSGKAGATDVLVGYYRQQDWQ